MAAGLILWTQSQQQHAVIKRRVLAGLIAVAATAGLIAIFTLHPQLPGSVAAIIGVIAAGLLLTLFLEHRREVARSLTALFATVGMAIIMVNLLVMPAYKSDHARVEFAQRINTLIGNDQTLYMIDVGYDEIIWHLGVPLLRIDDVRAMAQRQLPPDGIYALTRKRALPELERSYLVRQLDRPSAQKVHRGEDEAPILIHLAPRPATTQAGSY